MKKIEYYNIQNQPVYLADFETKINEIIDAINKIIELVNNR